MFEQLLAILTRIAVALEGAAIGGTGETAAPARGRGRPAKGEGATAAQAAAGAAGAQSAGAAVQQAQQPIQGAGEPRPETYTQPTLQKVADAIINLANDPNGGRDKAVKILSDHGVKKVPELKPEQFQSVLDAVAGNAKPAGSAGLF